MVSEILSQVLENMLPFEESRENLPVPKEENHEETETVEENIGNDIPLPLLDYFKATSTTRNFEEFAKGFVQGRIF